MNLYQSHEAQESASASAGETDKGRSFTAEVWDWLKSIAFALIVVILLNLFVFNLSTVKGHSMEPTLLEKEWLFVNKFSYWIWDPERGDVVILKDPDMQSLERQYLVKRVVATAGDRVEVRTGKLYVNGEAVDEPYTDIKIEDGDIGPVVVPDGHYFVMGDNRHQKASKDSRSFGAVPKTNIQGRADFILWPLNKLGGL